MRARLSRRCDRQHVHQPLTGGRCASAAFYSFKLVKEILLGIRDTADFVKTRKMFLLEHRESINAVTQSEGSVPLADDKPETVYSSIKKVKGGVLPIAFQQENFKARYIDEYTGEVLDNHLIQAALMEEMGYFNDHVWEVDTKDHMATVEDHVFVRSRWVLCNKGDDQSPDLRARLVACEINRGDKQDQFFASTPPLEAKKMIFAQYAKERKRNGKPLQLSFIDIRKAYFNGIPKRPIFMAFPKEMGLPSNFVARLRRCAYGTRDAGAIWEDTYRLALEGMGFVAGQASPCCFFHPERSIHVVVHGDDFTALGLQQDLDWYQSKLAEHFELKDRGRIGEDCELKQLRILNRVITLTEHGLEFEADPRHVDLISRSLGLTSSNAVATPGLKETNADYDAEKSDDPTISDLDGTVAALSRVDTQANGLRSCFRTRMPRPKDTRKIAFYPSDDVHEIQPYSEIYGTHPRFLASTAEGWKAASAHSDPYTSKAGLVMRERCAKAYSPERKVASRDYRRALLEGLQAASSLMKKTVSALRSDNQVMAARTKPAVSNKYAVKRQGAKAVKKMEQIPDSYLLSSIDATTFRALSARANYLSQDRPDINYASKELCREFAKPNRNSYARLKRLGRYLVGKPRVVYKYDWSKPGDPVDNTLELYVDTDFAGCKETRRSTSGGHCFLNGSLIKSWSKTQTTLSLSSGEAELHGICSGVTQGLGLQSVARDLGLAMNVRIHTDATAAIGMCRRRGMGKLRHLDVTDLWVQQKVRSGAVDLVKVLGADNPADMMTKYVERALIEKHMKFCKLVVLEGRAAGAPAAAGA